MAWHVRRGRFLVRSDMRKTLLRPAPARAIRRRTTVPAWRTDLPTETLHELADGVFVWLLAGGETGVANAGVIVEDDGLTVDRHAHGALAVGAVRRRGRRARPPGTALRAHPRAHRPRRRHQGVPRGRGVRARRPRAGPLDQPMPIDAYKAFMSAFADEFDDLAELGTRPVTHEVDGAAQLTPRVELLTAAGHTAGDLMVLVERRRRAASPVTCASSASPRSRSRAIRPCGPTRSTSLAELADVIVPGHGPSAAPRRCATSRPTCGRASRRRATPRAIGPGPWDAWIDRDARDAINVERAALLAAGPRRDAARRCCRPSASSSEPD